MSFVSARHNVITPSCPNCPEGCCVLAYTDTHVDEPADHSTEDYPDPSTGYQVRHTAVQCILCLYADNAPRFVLSVSSAQLNSATSYISYIYIYIYKSTTRKITLFKLFNYLIIN